MAWCQNLMDSLKKSIAEEYIIAFSFTILLPIYFKNQQNHISLTFILFIF